MSNNVSVEDLVIQNLVINEEFCRATLPYIQETYFEEKANVAIFLSLKKYFQAKNKLPQKSILIVEVKENNQNEKNVNEFIAVIENIYNSQIIKDTKWLVDQAEEWCRSRAMYLAIIKSISIYDGSETTKQPASIPDMMKEALSVSFKTEIGQDWFDDAEQRFDYYTNEENKIPFDLERLNEITNGGVTKKTLSIILAGVHVGKTLSLVHLAAGYSRQGYNVLYLSMEMGENEILNRIDANVLKTPMHQLKTLDKSQFLNRLRFIKQKGYGKIKVIQFPTSSAHSGHFRNVLNELNMKLEWRPDVIMVDYIGIVASYKLKSGSTNSHFYLKSVAEELRALAIEYDVAVWSAMQLTRAGMDSDNVEMTDIAESIGIPAVCDLIIALTRTEESDQRNEINVKQLKNRFKSIQCKSRFVLGCQFDQQLLMDKEETEEDENNPSINDKPFTIIPKNKKHNFNDVEV